MPEDDNFPPPSPDPGNDPERILRDVREQKPKLGCLGVTVTGGWALLGLVSLVAVLLYLLTRILS